MQQDFEFTIGDKVLIIKQEEIMRGTVGKVVSHIMKISDTREVKVKFEFKKGDYSPRPRNYAHKASNIQYRIFNIKDLIMDTKLNRLLYS